MSEQKDFPKKYEKKLPTGYSESVESMDTEEIKSKIYEAQGHIYEIEKAKDADDKLNAAREIIKDLSAPYKDAQAAENAKIKWCFYVLEGRGVQITPDS